MPFFFWGKVYYLRIFFYSVFGFTIPIVLALHFGPKWFERGIPPSNLADSRARLASNASGLQGTDENEKPGQSALEPQNATLTVPSDAALDPESGKYFIVSLNLKLGALPRTGKRQKLIAKYSSETTPYPGWALAIRKLNTSTRPEVYWQNKDGKGGWHTFDDVRFSRNQWYSLTLVAKDSDLISLYVEKLDSRPVDETDPDDEDPDATQAVRFLGGYNVSSFAVAPTAASLEFSPPLLENGDYRGEVKNILIARPSRIPLNQSKLRQLLQGGSTALFSQLETDEVSLWVDEAGLDQSRARRNILVQSVHS